MTPVLIITRGLPASGKTTKAKAWVQEDPLNRARVNRDDMRKMLQGGRLGTSEQEMMVNKIRDASIAALLKRGVSVVADDMNLQQRYARDLRRLATFNGANFEVWDLTNVPVDECVRRDAFRGGPDMVTGDVIRDLHKRYLAGKTYPLPFPEEPIEEGNAVQLYVPKPGTPRAVLVDLDGTTCLMTGRSPFDWSRVHEDRPNPTVVLAIEMFDACDVKIVFLSGRQSSCREATEEWLEKHVAVSYDALLMRPANDNRKDSIVKLELFDKYVRDNYDVLFSLDDRDQVVRLWRDLGITCFQVADGNF